MGKNKYAKSLKESFIKWLEEKGNEVYDIGETAAETLPKALNLEQNVFYDKYIKPIADLSKLQRHVFFKTLSYHLADKYSPLPYVIKYSINQNIDLRPNALDWLLVHVRNLNLFEFDEKIPYECPEPYNQCIFCGRPDSYRIKDGRKELIINFDKKKHFCHEFDCHNIGISNPEVHEPNCHYAIWARKKKTLIDRIKHSRSKERAIEIFLDFCEKQFQENMTIKYFVQKYEYTLEEYVDLEDENKIVKPLKGCELSSFGRIITNNELFMD